jgi:type IV secretion system protein VirB4
VWRLDRVPFECADEHTIAERHEAKCSLLRNLAGGQFAVWEHRLHRVVEDALMEPAEPGFARDLARAYAASLRGQRMMSNELYLTLVYRPAGSRLGRALQSNRRSRDEIAQAQAEALRLLEEKSALVERVMRAFDPRLLGVETRHGREFSEVAEFLGYLVNGVWRPVPVHAGPPYRTLPTTRLSFGADKLELRHGDGRRYAAFVDIHEYADAVQPGVLNALLYERSEFIETQSFSILPGRDAMRALELQRDQLIASDDVVATFMAVGQLAGAFDLARRFGLASSMVIHLRGTRSHCNAVPCATARSEEWVSKLFILQALAPWQGAKRFEIVVHQLARRNDGRIC